MNININMNNIPKQKINSMKINIDNNNNQINYKKINNYKSEKNDKKEINNKTIEINRDKENDDVYNNTITKSHRKFIKNINQNDSSGVSALLKNNNYENITMTKIKRKEKERDKTPINRNIKLNHHDNNNYIYNNINNDTYRNINKIIILKKCYIETLIKRHFEKYPSKKKQIIYEANLPKKRNDLKKVYHEMMKVINEKLKEKDNQKYYHILILDILKKHENIEQKEINDELKLYKNNLKNKEKENKNKVIKKSKKNEKNNWSVNIGNLLIFLIPMAFAAYYLNTNIK